ncbi:hypothetical protein, partial [Enterococcus faecium]|uniref:hypothetical protein n=1 Tax=Enterococcus faecium TaxID=1352 RepID=UPI0015F04061
MIGREEKGNFDKKEEVSDFPVNKNRVGKKKRFEEVYGYFNLLRCFGYFHDLWMEGEKWESEKEKFKRTVIIRT